jgi:tripartite ATP-independent transporter DctP family solute receptor
MNIRRNTRGIIAMTVTVLVLTGLMCTLPSMSIAAPIEIKLTTVQLKSQQMGIGIDRFSKYATELLKDKVRIRTYPAAQLYTGQEEIQALMKGEIQMAYIIASSLDYLHPSMELTKLPYLAPDIETAYAYMDGSTGKKLFALMEPKNIHLMGVVSSGTVVVSNNKRPVRNVEDLKGLKMRSFGPMGAATLKALGAMGVVTASEETYTALQQGVIDGATTPAGVFIARKYYDVQKFTTNPGMLNATFAYLIANREWFKKLPADVQAGLTAAANRVIREQRKEIQEEDDEVFKQIAAKGCQVITLTPAEQGVWKKALQPVYTEYGPKIGLDLIKEAQTEVEKASKGKK